MKRPAACFLIFLMIFCIYNYTQINIRTTKRSDYIDTTRTIHTVTHRNKFCIAYNTTKATKSFREDGLEPITLATHSTSQYLNILDQLLQSWDSPVSLALYIDRGSSGALQYLLDLHRCNRSIAEKLSVHVVYQLSAFQDKCQPLQVHKHPISCLNFTSQYRKNQLNTLVSPFGIYPINVMRNVARRGAPSHFHLISDVEMVFSSNFALHAKRLANEHIRPKSKNLIVIRRFEIESGVEVPRNHTSLKELIDSRKAHEYHHKLFPVGHTIKALWEWFKRSKGKPEPYVWEIPYKNPMWEPQFIMTATDPFSEESMPTRLRDQQALTYELCRANYTFLLASQLFNVHRGVKRFATNFDNAVVQHQIRFRYSAFIRFKRRMDADYPKTLKRCNKFTM
uniref:I-beta-1,3-N-acetylglucosaminyltransferase n=1 Tax=Haemonchus contortus TaxID=6289 RepID=A0A7I4YGZ7_HAECO